MRDKAAVWGILLVIGFVALVCLALSPTPRPKVRAQRITSVNTLRSFSFTLTNSAPLPSARPGSSR